MSGQGVANWHDFYVAIVGAGAALAGLVMVALSVNITKILQFPSLPARAGSAIGSLILVVIAGGLGLIPGQSAPVLGMEILVATLVAVELHAVAVVQSIRQPTRPLPSRIMSIPISVLQLAPLAVGSIILMVGNSGGLHWIAIGMLLTMIGSMLGAWVLMVEILR